jgi:hypothetical protein
MMTRVDYLVHPFGSLAGARRVPRELHGPLLAFASAIAFAAVLQAIESERLRDARDDATRASRAFAAMQGPVERARAERREVERLRAALDARDATRRAGEEAVNDVARIANALPRGTWLTSLRVDPAMVMLDGRAHRVDDVAGALDGLSAVPGVRAVRLLSAREEPANDDVAYAIAVERTR